MDKVYILSCDKLSLNSLINSFHSLWLIELLKPKLLIKLHFSHNTLISISPTDLYSFEDKLLFKPAKEETVAL